jgi:hypothetical protein
MKILKCAGLTTAISGLRMRVANSVNNINMNLSILRTPIPFIKDRSVGKRSSLVDFAPLILAPGQGATTNRGRMPDASATI